MTNINFIENANTKQEIKVTNSTYEQVCTFFKSKMVEAYNLPDIYKYYKEQYNFYKAQIIE